MTAYNDIANDMASRHGRDKTALETDRSYYDSTYRVTAIGIATPEEMRQLLAHIGWSRSYLDAIEERLDPEGFRLAGRSKADKRLWDWWEANNMTVNAGMGMLEALIHGRAYGTVAAPDPADDLADPDAPVLRIESPRSLMVDTDIVTGRVKKALRLYTESDAAHAERATLLLPNETVLLKRSGANGPWMVDRHVEHNLNRVLVVPIVNRARLTLPKGESEITPELRSISDTAARTMMNMQAAAELMAVPQRLLFGVAQEALAANPESPGSVLEAYLARIIAVEDPEAHAMQFAAADLRNFVEVLGELAKQAASITGLPPQYLSFASDNPSSAEAIRSSESRLVKKCERKQRVFGWAFEEMLRLGMLVMDGKISKPARRLETIWRDPATPTFASKADAVVKLASAQTPEGKPIIPVERARIDLGYSDEERREMEAWDNQSPNGRLSALYAPQVQETTAQPDAPEAEAA